MLIHPLLYDFLLTLQFYLQNKPKTFQFYPYHFKSFGLIVVWYKIKKTLIFNFESICKLAEVLKLEFNYKSVIVNQTKKVTFWLADLIGFCFSSFVTSVTIVTVKIINKWTLKNTFNSQRKILELCQLFLKYFKCIIESNA